MFLSVEVSIDDDDIALANRFGKLRNDLSMRDGRRDRHGFNGNTRTQLDGEDVHQLGVIGEIVWAKYYGIENWEPTVNTFKAPDFEPDIQIKTRARPDYGLIVRRDDKDEEIFVLISPADGQYYAKNNVPRTWVIRGAALGHEAKQDRFLKSHGGRAPAWFIDHEQFKLLEHDPDC